MTGELVIGIDVGGTTIKAAVVNSNNGSVSDIVSFTTPAHEHIDSTITIIHKIITGYCASYPDIKKAGIGFPGSFDRERKNLHYPPNFPQWRSEPIHSLLHDALPQLDRIEVDNDANCAARAEALFGAGKDLRSFIMITLGTGVGGCIWFDGDVYRGEFGGAGEFGHLSIDRSGAKCHCGAYGCIEAYLGRDYMTMRAQKKLPNITEPADITKSALLGNADAMEFLYESGIMLGAAMASAARLLDITTFIVTGGIADAGDLLLTPAENELRRLVFEQQRKHVSLRRAMMKNAGILGAGLLTLV